MRKADVMTASGISRWKTTKGRMCAVALWGLFAVLLMPVRVMAQVATADILGRVQDATKALVPKAAVTIENLDTGVKRSLTTNDAGEFTAASLPIGRYRVTISSPGFSTYQVPELILSQGDRVRTDATLTIGASETIDVASVEPQLQTDSSTIGTVVTEREVQDLPLNGRNFMELAQVLAGTNEGPPNALNSGTRPDDRRLTSSVSTNGQDENANNQLIDGLDNNERIIGAIGARPSIDAIAEFRVQTNLYTAEVGRSAGAIINIITKGGTNTYHGSLYEFFRNDLFDASNWGSISHTELRQNQYGGSLGGFILRDKLFFFADYEGFRQVQAVTALSTVPTCFERANIGNFSDISHTSVPATTAIDPIGLAYWQLYPLPNYQNGVKTGCPNNTATSKNFSSSPNTTRNLNTGDGRLDYALPNGDHTFVRYTINQGTVTLPGNLPTASTYANATVAGRTTVSGQPMGGTISGGTLVSGISPGGNVYNFSGQSNQMAMNSQIDYVHLFTAQLLAEFRVGYTFIDNHALPLNYGQNFAAALGLQGANLGDLGTSQLTPVGPQGYSSVGDGIFLPLENRDNTLQGNAQFTLQHGKQSIKWGASLIRRHATSAESNYAAGNIVTGTYTGGGVFGSVSCAPLGCLLRGLVYQTQRSNQLVEPGYRTWEPSGYFQDDYRVHPRLTLNLGIRYDLYTPFTEAHGRISNFNPYTLKLMVPGTYGVGKTAGVNTDYSNVAPRVGFAFMAAPKTVFRGGFGLTFIPISSGARTALGNAPYVFNYQTLKNTTTLAQGLPRPFVQDPTNVTATTTSGLTLSGIDPNYRSSYIEQFNLTMQQEFGRNSLQISYVGAIGKHLRQNPNLNLVAPGGVTGTTDYNDLPFDKAFPGVSTVNEMISEGYSSYNSLQAVFARRFTKNVGINANYTWAHGLNNAPNYAAGYGGNGVLPYQISTVDYGNSDLDIRNRFAMLLNVALPFGQNAKGFKARLLKGWQTNAIWIQSTGLPFSVTDDTATSNTGATSERSMLVGDPRAVTTAGGCPVKINGGTTYMTNKDVGTPNFFFNTCAFANQPASQYIPSERNLLYGPHYRTFNLSIFKTFPIYDRAKLQFRCESFNLTNTPNFANPDSGLGDTAFGQITAVRGGSTPRQLQFALKLLF
ncbi:TonB-dependent receptor [Granulicella cerasi]|nr:TonB-dependent receptor [Granulicella cerasi]